MVRSVSHVCCQVKAPSIWLVAQRGRADGQECLSQLLSDKKAIWLYKRHPPGVSSQRGREDSKEYPYILLSKMART
jgi:hypothetical protein